MVHDITYLDANRWEQIILSYMSNLQEFHMKHGYCIYSDPHYINQFTSSFWIERPVEIFYSTYSYK